METLSANTEVIICSYCPESGGTLNSIVPPHPIWTNSNGDAVIQLNAITLGGPNGLNN
jgi:hypothetical protein